MRMKASVPCSRGGCSTISWSYGTPAGEATARASSAVTAAGLSRRSTTTISLPMPFILANAWLASALMEIPNLCLPYMANGGGLTSAQGPQGHLTYLSWDESATCVLGMMASWRACRGHTATAWNGDEEHEPYQHFPRRFGCAGPVGRARAGRACAGAIAGAVGRSGARGDAQPGAGSHPC